MGSVFSVCNEEEDIFFLTENSYDSPIIIKYSINVRNRELLKTPDIFVLDRSTANRKDRRGISF